jgi:hypothetical protein
VVKAGDIVLVRDDIDEQWEQAKFVCYNDNFTYPFRVVGVNEDVPETLDSTFGYIYCK